VLSTINFTPKLQVCTLVRHMLDHHRSHCDGFFNLHFMFLINNYN
jgi:hypothetical protein